MAETRQEKSAGAIIYYANGEIRFLLLKYPTYWGFSKGIMEKNETEQQAAEREVKEETGLNIELIKGFKHIQKWFFRAQNQLVHKEAVFFLAKIKKEDAEKVKISFEHENFAWLSFEEAIKTIKIKQNKEMLTTACNFIKEYEKQTRLIR